MILSFRKISLVSFALLMLSLYCILNNGGLMLPIIKNDWYNPPKENISFQETDIKIFFIKEQKVKQAIQHLKNDQFQELDDNQVSEMIGTHDKGKYLLVRAICFSKNHEGFSLSKNGRDLYIYHGSLGDFHTMKKYPLIIKCDISPQNIYLDCSTDI